MARNEIEEQVREVRMSALDSPAASWAGQTDKDQTAHNRPLPGAFTCLLSTTAG